MLGHGAIAERALSETKSSAAGGGSITVTPSAADVILDRANPTVRLGSLTLTPTAADVLLAGVDPVVVLGSHAYTPTAADVILDRANPIVVRGSLTLTPSAADVILAGTDPTVTIGGGPAPSVGSEGGRRLRWTYWHWRRFTRWS